MFYKDSRKFETGTISYSLFEAWKAGLELVLEIGVDVIYENVLKSTDLIIDKLNDKGLVVITPIKNRKERSAIVHFNKGSYSSTKLLFEKLKANNIIVTLQAENIRVSLNFFTTKGKIQIFLDSISK